MDDIDVKILRLLQQNARKTISDLSAEIGMSMPAISERLKKLENAGVIEKYCAILNPRKLNKELIAVMFVGLESPRYSDSFTEFVKGEPDIQECLYITGEFDFSLKVITNNTRTLETLLNKIKAHHGIARTKTIVALSTVISKPSIQPD